MIKVSSRVQALNESPIVTSAAMAAKCKDVISFANGSPGHGPIPQVRQMIGETSFKDISIYRTPHYGSRQGRENAAKYFQQRYGLDFDPEDNINLSTGFTHLFHCLCVSLFNPGDTAIFMEPYFPQYQQPIALVGAKMVFVPTQEQDNWKPKPEAIKTAFSNNPDAKMIVFNYPNNPSGATLTESDWNGIIDVLLEEIIRRTKLNAELPLVLLDEAYVPLFHHGELNEHPTFGLTLHKRLKGATEQELDLLDQLMRSCLIACTISKEGMAGVLLGMGASRNKKLIEAMRLPQKASVINSSVMGEIALSAAIQPDPQKTLAWAGSLYESRLNQLALGLNSIFEKNILIDKNASRREPASFIPNAGMYLYANFSSLKGIEVTSNFLERLKSLGEGQLDLKSLYTQNKLNTNLEIALWLLLEAKVSTVPMGTPEDCYLRFSVGLPQAIVETKFQEIDREKTEEHGKELINQALLQINQVLQKK